MTGLANWLNQRSVARAGLVAHDLARRQDLLRDFIVEASKIYGDARSAICATFCRAEPASIR